MYPTSHPTGHRLCRSLLLFIVPALLLPTWCAAAKPAKAESRELKREMATDGGGAKPGKRDDSADVRGGKPGSGDPQARLMEKLRDRLEVTDDAEWAVIAERINKVEELRRNGGTSAPGGRASPAFSDKGKRSARPGSSAHPEQEALRAAVSDKLPDAEIKARLARVHEVFQQQEARLLRAQSELRAVLTVRQEAVAVMAGLLPP